MENISNNKKIIGVITTLQEAFSAVIPFFLITSLFTLLYFLVIYFNLQGEYIKQQNLELMVKIFNSFTSIIANIAISYFLSIRLNISQIVSIILAITTYITMESPILKTSFDPSHGFTPITLLNPIISTLFLKLFFQKFSLNIPLQNANKHIYKLFNYIPPFMIAYIFTVFTFFILSNIMEYPKELLQKSLELLPMTIVYLIRDFFIQLFWFFGIHGDHMVNALLGKSIGQNEIFPNLTYGEFNRIFVVLGGAGVGIALLISLMLYAKDKTVKLIVKISAPFVIFNINTLLTYSVVVFNRFFIIPFLFMPLFNFIFAYFALKYLNINFTECKISWITPPFVDSYLKTDGNFIVMFLQLILIFIDTAVYIYFTKKYLASQSFKNHFERLEENLEISGELKAQENIVSYSAYLKIIDANVRLNDIVDTINRDNLLLYYQPQIDIKKGRCRGFEALLRYRVDGKIKGPIFLDAVEDAGLAPIIDLWVSKEVKKSFEIWESRGFYPEVSVNIHPDTLKSDEAIEKIIQMLKDKNVTLEIIERSFVGGDSAERNLSRLLKSGFAISIDDFGIGYSNFDTVIKHNVVELKIDKGLIDIIHTKKGYFIVKHIASMCRDIDSLVVAEGVETKRQLDIIKTTNIRSVQGFYFSKAIPFDEVEKFYKTFRVS